MDRPRGLWHALAQLPNDGRLTGQKRGSLTPRLRPGRRCGATPRNRTLEPPSLKEHHQAEVLTRISIFLTLTSAGLVGLALAGQAMTFDGTFVLLAVTILVVVIIVGQLSQIRVLNVGVEDLSYVLAMNRIRAAYAEIDPGIVPYLMTSRFDDRWFSADLLHASPAHHWKPCRRQQLGYHRRS